MNGVPRLVQQDFYWGEIDRASAIRFAEEARSIGWKAAVNARFPENSDASIAIMDWQRASWTPLLGLAGDAVVLDVGSGYGAITHALASTYGEVHSLEAIPERVEFTRTRVSQEGLNNVHLVQGSALRLPYPRESFDAIVVNGILEWIGDWDPEGDPRSAQLRFIRRVHSLLKPGGALVIGIENRISYNSLLGELDHSGLPFTNLLPRRLASATLRTFGKSHHRMEHPSQSYRTYTYSERGYRALLREGGFESVRAFWADPGYNQPYRLTPLNGADVRVSLEEQQLDPSSLALSLFGRLKKAAASIGLLKYVVPEFLFIVHKGTDDAQHPWRNLLPFETTSDSRALLTTRKFGGKTTLRILSSSHATAIVKASTPAPDSAEAVATEFTVLESVARNLGNGSGNAPFSVPSPQKAALVGKQLITVESVAKGEQLSLTLLRLSVERRKSFLNAHLPQLVRVATSMSERLRRSEIKTSASKWLLAAEALLEPSLQHRARLIRARYDGYGAHGDLTAENLIVDLSPATPAITVVDWESATRGVPPLYDLFVMYLSLLPAIDISPDVPAQHADAPVAQAYTAFFGVNEWSRLFSDTLLSHIEPLGIARSQVWEMFLDSLMIRTGYFVERRSSFAELHARISSMALSNQARFQL